MRTHYCGKLSAALLGQTVTLAGWAHRRRDHGGVIFIDLRDREGLAQIVSDPDREATFAAAEKIRNEFVLKVTGLVRRRPEGTVNPNIASGEVEVLAHEIEILNASLAPPFQLDDENLSETVRLTHRVIDLRRETMQKNMMLRYRVAMAVRKYLDARGFIDIETPMLTRSTPEGARDYLVPSRVHAGEFFALPQSPQLFKQLLMIAGYDRYYQITRCFRDEDLRADRQPEFTQIDCETSFLDETEIRAIFEGLIRVVFKEVLGVALPDPFPVMSYAEATRDYGSDKPDLRVPLKLTELTDLMRAVDFKVFRAAAELPNGRVAALCLPGGASLTRKEIDDLPAFVADRNLTRVTAVACDLVDADAVRDLGRRVGRADAVLHLAANGDPAVSAERARWDLELNTVAVVNVLEQIAMDRMVYMSSGAVYDGLRGPVSPATPVNPLLPYAISKLASERYVAFFAERRRLLASYANVRFFGAYGPYEAPRKITTRWLLDASYCFERNACARAVAFQ